MGIRGKIFVSLVSLAILVALITGAFFWAASSFKEALGVVSRSASQAEKVVELYAEVEKVGRLLYVFSSPVVPPEEREAAYREFEETLEHLKEALRELEGLEAAEFDEYLKELETVKASYVEIRKAGIPNPVRFSRMVAKFKEELLSWITQVQEAVQAEAEFQGPLSLSETAFGAWAEECRKLITNERVLSLVNQISHLYGKLFFSAKKINSIVNSDLEDISGPLLLLLDSEIYPMAREILSLFEAMEEESEKVLAKFEAFKKEVARFSQRNAKLLTRLTQLKKRYLEEAVTARDETERFTSKVSAFVAVVAVISAVILVAFFVFVPRLVLRSLNELDAVVSRLSGTSDVSDLTQRLAVRARDETGRIAANFNRFLDGIHQLVKEISGESAKLYEASQEVRQALSRMEEVSRKATEEGRRVRSLSVEVREEVGSLVEAVTQLTQTIEEISSNAQKLKELADASAKETRRAQEDIKELEKSLQEIRRVGELIGNLAEQTNLLALNATIEASRAGEAGKGFAVVANEVKELARQTASSVEEISKTIEDIIRRASQVSSTMERTREAAVETADFSSGIAAAIEEQAVTVKDISERVQEIDRRAEETKQMGERIVEGLEENTAHIERTASVAQRLREAAVKLKSLVERFKI